MRFVVYPGVAVIAIALCVLLPSQAINAATVTPTSCGTAGYNGPWGCVLVGATTWAPDFANLGDLNVYNNQTILSYVGPDTGYSPEFQSTELAIRFASIVWGEGSTFAEPEDAWRAVGWTGTAEDMWNVAANLPVPLRQISNGDGAPRFGDLIVFSDGAGPGDVGVVVKVSGGHLYFVGENQANAPAEAWIPISAKNVARTGGDFSNQYQVVGWLRGPTWLAQTTTSPSSDVNSELNSVSCPTATACVAVGVDTAVSGRQSALAESQNGTKWVLAGALNRPRESSELSGVSCTSKNWCMAVGSVAPNPKQTSALTETWNGKRWTVHSVAKPPLVETSRLNGVSCTSSSSCTAVGSYVTGTGGDVALAEQWNGKGWAVERTASTTQGVDVLNAVSCSSASACVAVGSGDGGNVPLAEQWNGNAWTLQPTSPLTTLHLIDIRDVSCSSASSCVAVGASNGSLLVTAAQWNGNAWAADEAPTGFGSGLEGVSCLSATNCVGVGFSGSNTLATQWLGTKWATQGAASPSGTSNVLTSVSCTARGCTAVGYDVNAKNDHQTLAESISFN